MTEFDRQLAKKQYRDLLRKFHAKEEELRQMLIFLAQLKDAAGIEDPLPGEAADEGSN